MRGQVFANCELFSNRPRMTGRDLIVVGIGGLAVSLFVIGPRPATRIAATADRQASLKTGHHCTGSDGASSPDAASIGRSSL
jgi:hypothetical protein